LMSATLRPALYAAAATTLPIAPPLLGGLLAPGRHPATSVRSGLDQSLRRAAVTRGQVLDEEGRRRRELSLLRSTRAAHAIAACRTIGDQRGPSVWRPHVFPAGGKIPR
jgi:hypothetical protein